MTAINIMRDAFERAVRESRFFRHNTPLGVMLINGEFGHYMEPDTDTMWIGFALGYRVAERDVARIDLLRVLVRKTGEKL